MNTTPLTAPRPAALPPPCCRSCLITDQPFVRLHDTTYLECFHQIAGCDEHLSATLPDTICEQCLHVLQIAVDFRHRCQQSEKVLLERCQPTTSNKLAENDCIMSIEILDEEAMIDDQQDEVAELMLAAEKEDTNSEESKNPKNHQSSKPSSPSPTDSQCTEENEYLQEPLEYDDEVDYLDADSLSTDELYADANETASMPDKRNEQPDKSISIVCTVCKLVFENRLTFTAHMQASHNLGWTHMCTDCGMFFASSDHLRRHSLEHMPKEERPYVCDICSKSYISRSGMVTHMEMHTGRNKDFMCSDCGKRFQSQVRLRIHTRVHSGERNFVCDTCDKSFTTKGILALHYKQRHSASRPPVGYRCDVCGAMFTAASSLKGHMRIHTGERPYKCTVCAKTFAGNTALRYHMPTHNGYTIPCPHCGRKFSRQSYLRQHVLTHTGETPFECVHCAKGFKQKRQLEVHLDAHHPGVEYACTECGQAFGKVAALKEHLRTTHARRIRTTVDIAKYEEVEVEE